MLTDFTFKDTGITVKIQKVSPMLAMDIDAAIPRPEPPLNEVDYGEGRGKVQEPNLQDPAYLKALDERTSQVGLAVIKATILRGVVVEADGWQAKVSDYRQFIQETTGKPLQEQSDLYVYITRLCVGTDEDLTDLVNAITKRSQPTQEEIERSKASFRSKV